MFKWIKKIFNKPKTQTGFDFLKTDIHSHLIPGIDDGVKTLDDSIKIIESLYKLGYQKIITTPHVMKGLYENNSKIILNGLDLVRSELKSRGLNIHVDAAAEYYLDYNLEKIIKSEKLLTFGDNYVLVETSFVEAPLNFKDLIFKLQLSGYKVVLAHPERYHYLNLSDFQELDSKSVFLQLNLLSLLGYYGSDAQIKSRELINKDLISFVGTDCHNIQQFNFYKECKFLKSFAQLAKSSRILNSEL